MIAKWNYDINEVEYMYHPKNFVPKNEYEAHSWLVYRDGPYLHFVEE